MSNYLKRYFKLFSVYRLPYEVKPPYTHVVQVGDPVLRHRAEEIQRDNISRDTIKKLIKTLKAIIVNDNLVGISAPQVGLPLRVIIHRCMHDNFSGVSDSKEQEEIIRQTTEMKVWINPDMKIEDYSTCIGAEMCASIVSLKADVKRYRKVSLTGLNENGESVKEIFHGFLARVVQHEMDHLEGILFTDKMNVKTLHNPLWGEINELNGFVELNYYPKA